MMKSCAVFIGLLALLSGSEAQDSEATTLAPEDNENPESPPSPYIDLYYPFSPPVRQPPAPPAPIGPKPPLRPPSTLGNQFGLPPNRPLSPLFNDELRNSFPGLQGFSQTQQLFGGQQDPLGRFSNLQPQGYGLANGQRQPVFSWELQRQQQQRPSSNSNNRFGSSQSTVDIGNNFGLPSFYPYREIGSSFQRPDYELNNVLSQQRQPFNRFPDFF